MVTGKGREEGRRNGERVCIIMIIKIECCDCLYV